VVLDLERSYKRTLLHFTDRNNTHNDNGNKVVSNKEGNGESGKGDEDGNKEGNNDGDK
jgi:hypothetical protein